jgi:methanogenic corrinoid protein MtbC1
MSSFQSDGSVQENSGREMPANESWPAASGASAADFRSTTAQRADLELRMALLAQAIEHEIIPRLMLAHRSPNDCLIMPALTGQQVSPEDVQNFAKLVLSTDDHVAQACVDTMRSRGVPVESIYLDLLAPVARHLGELWEQDLCDFTEVTIGLGRLQQVLRELSPAFSQSNDNPANGRRVLLLPGPGDQHTFGLVMVSEFFRRAGWDVAGGPWDAGADAVSMVRREWFDVIGFSLGSEIFLDELAESIRLVRQSAMNPHMAIIVGGPIFAQHPDYAQRIGADGAATDGKRAPELAERLVTSRAARC